MKFLRHNDDIINLDRITRIYKEEVVRNRTTGFGIEVSYNIVLVGDGQELKIKCESQKEADKMIENLWEITKRCSRYFCF